MDRTFIERAGPRLKLEVRHGIGYNTLDVPTATQYGVLCANTPDAPTESIAEHAVGLLLQVLAGERPSFRIDSVAWLGRVGTTP